MLQGYLVYQASVRSAFVVHLDSCPGFYRSSLDARSPPLRAHSHLVDALVHAQKRQVVQWLSEIYCLSVVLFCCPRKRLAHQSRRSQWRLRAHYFANGGLCRVGGLSQRGNVLALPVVQIKRTLLHNISCFNRSYCGGPIHSLSVIINHYWSWSVQGMLVALLLVCGETWKLQFCFLLKLLSVKLIDPSVDFDWLRVQELNCIFMRALIYFLEVL